MDASLFGKIGLISDAHGNIGAIRKAVEIIRRAGVGRIFFLGDAVGYIPSRLVLDFLDIEEIFSLKGNHEAMLLEEIDDVGESAARIYRLEEVRKLLTEDEKVQISTRSAEANFECTAGRVLLCHGSPDEPLTGYIYPDTPLDTIARRDFDVVFMGHTHRPFLRRSNGRLYVNVGSCGQPRDHGRFGSACVFDTDTGEATILRFDIHSETRDAIVAADLEETYVAEVLERVAVKPIVGTMTE